MHAAPASHPKPAALPVNPGPALACLCVSNSPILSLNPGSGNLRGARCLTYAVSRIDTERQLTTALPKMAKATTKSWTDLRTAIEEHLEETRGRLHRLEDIFELCDARPKGKHCAGIAGIIEEASGILKEDASAGVRQSVAHKRS
jgi:hypothetical protein